MKKATLCTFILIICLIGGHIFANPVELESGTYIPEMIGSIAIVVGVIGLIGEFGELSILGFYDYYGGLELESVSWFIGIPIGFIFPGEGRLFYITNPQFAHKDGDFYPAIEIVPEIEFFSFYYYILPAVFLRIKYPLIFRKKNKRPCFAVTPFIEAGSDLDLQILGVGAGLIMQYRRVAFGGRYRMYYDSYSGEIIQGFGFTFSCDIVKPLFNRRI